jgi:preprotein translocase subunit SecD
MKVRNKVILLLVTFVFIAGTFGLTMASNDRPVLGLDLQGGISIVLFPVKGSDLSALNTATDIIRNRVDALGIAEPEVNRQGDTIVVDLPGVKDRAKAESLVGQTAELRFRQVLGCIAACGIQPPPEALAKLDQSATGSSTTTTAAPGASTTSTTAATGVTISTAPIAAVRPAQTASSTTAAPTTTAAGATTTAPGGSTTTTAAKTTPTTTQKDAEAAAAKQIAQTCDKLIATRAENVATAQVWLPMRDANKNKKHDEGCEYLDAAKVIGSDVKSARATYTNGWIVDVSFKNDNFQNLIGQPLAGQPVAIELDGIVQSSPTIDKGGITGRNVTISGSFSQGESKDLALVLKYGSLPVQFDPDEQTVQSVSPTLGKDQLHAGIVAGVIGLGLVALYMIFYYRLLGAVVWTGLALTALILFTLTSYLSAHRGLTLTLAGVTGIIVSVGVTVDSYVVYFERLKDEVRSGKTVRSSLDAGFRKAWRTIIAADFVSILAAIVLYWLATGGVRGFAFFLLLSTAIDLVLAYCFMHPLVVLLARRPALVRMRGIGIATGLDVPEART